MGSRTFPGFHVPRRESRFLFDDCALSVGHHDRSLPDFARFPNLLLRA
jgi:hypothetical protein